MGISILGLSGPAFLGLYAAVATLTLATAYLYIRVSDPTRARAPPSVPTAPDAIALAYLSGGANNVIRTILFDLRRRGFVGVTADHRLEPTRSPEPKSALDPRAARMLEALRGRPKPDDLFSDKALAADIDQLCTTERRRLHAEDLLRPAEVDSAARGAAALGSLILIGLSGAKLYVAHSEGRDNVMFLVALAFFAEMILWAIVSRAWNRAASARGTAHVRAIRRAYEGRLAQTARAGAAFDAGSLFLVGLFGYAALKDTSEAEFARLFQKSVSDSSGSCGSGGDGGGSGCGGCGGGD